MVASPRRKPFSHLDTQPQGWAYYALTGTISVSNLTRTSHSEIFRANEMLFARRQEAPTFLASTFRALGMTRLFFPPKTFPRLFQDSPLPPPQASCLVLTLYPFHNRKYSSPYGIEVLARHKFRPSSMYMYNSTYLINGIPLANLLSSVISCY